MRKTLFLTIITTFILMFGASAFGQTTIINYDFASAMAGTPCTATPLTAANGVTSALTTSTGTCTTPGGAAVTSPPAFVANDMNQSVSITGFATGATQYFQFQLGGANLPNFSSYMLFFQSMRSSTGPTTATIQYSTDGVTYTSFPTTYTVGTGITNITVDLSGITAINNQAAVYFRIVGSGGNNGGGTFRIDNFQIQAVGPTAAPGTVSGRVIDTNGNAVSRAYITVTGGDLSAPVTVLTSSFGYYTVEGLTAGSSYIVSARAKGYEFDNPSQFVDLTQNATDLDFIGRR